MQATARQCAAEIMGAILTEKRPLDESLQRHAGMFALSVRDRAFARLMIMTVLRRLGQIDALLGRLLEKPLTGRTADVMHCLRLGLAQLLWLETPPHAAVHAMVETVEAMGHERMKGVVNAVLKRAAAEGPAIVAAQDAAALNLPGWIFDSWRNSYGEATARAIALARLDEPPLDITVKAGADDWARRLGGEALPTGSVRLSKAGRVEELEGYAQGAWWVQDTAASLPVRWLGNVEGLDVLDLCAAPGGKTAQLAAAGARVTAVDKAPRRLERLRDNLARLGLKAECVEADVMRYAPAREYDVVLLDAPCTATGTMRRHPEVTWHKSKEDVVELARIQRRMLNRAAGWVRPGGRLLYCVCSLEPEEGERQAEAFAASHPGFACLPPPGGWITLGLATQNGALRTHPDCLAEKGGMDGFYAICRQRLNNI